MTYERAAEILDPEHRERYESIEIVNEACLMGREALFRQMPGSPHPDGDESILGRSFCPAMTMTCTTNTCRGGKSCIGERRRKAARPEWKRFG